MLKHNVEYSGMLVLTFVKVRVRVSITLACIERRFSVYHAYIGMVCHRGSFIFLMGIATLEPSFRHVDHHIGAFIS